MPTSLSLGAEISKNFVKLALIQVESSHSALLLDYTLIPLSTKDQDSKKDPIAIITNVLKEKKLFTATDVRLAISGIDMDSKRVTLPFMPKDEIEQALKWQAKDIFLLEAEESMLDFEVLQEQTAEDGTKNLEVIATAVRKSLVEEKLSSFHDTEIVKSAVLPAAYCLSCLHALDKAKDQKDPIALLDIGSLVSTLVIVKGGRARFIRQIGCGGDDFTKAMVGTHMLKQDGTELSMSEAERLKREIGIPDESAQQTIEGLSLQQITALLRPILEKMVTEIRRSTDYYLSQFNEGSVVKIILSGGTSKLKNICSQLSSKLQIPVECLDLPVNLRLGLGKDKLEAIKNDFCTIVPAIGAGLSDLKGVNLIPDSYKQESLRKIKKTSVRIIFIFVSLMLLTLHIFNMAQDKALQNVISAREPQWQKLQDAQNLHQMITQRNNIIKHTLKNQVPLYYIFKSLSNIVPREIYLQSIDIKDKATSMRIRGITLETKETAEVSLAGFIKLLEDSPLFNNVLLDSSEDVIALDREAVEFQINCSLAGQR